MERWLIKNGTLLTMERGESPVVGDVLVEDDRIAAVGRDLSVDARVIDATGAIVAPGMVDTHRHTWQTAARGLASNEILKDYFRSVRFQGSIAFTPDDMRIGTLAGMLEALDAGVTTVMDFNNNVSSADGALASLDGIRSSGIRSQFGLGMNHTFGQDQALSTLDGRLALLRRVRSDELASDDSLVTLRVALSDLPEVGIDRVATEVDAARGLGVPSTTNSLAILFHEPVNDIAEYEKRGLLGPDILWVHNIYASDAQLRLIADHGMHTAVCPESELALGMGRPATTRLLAASGRCAFGCDTVSSTSGSLLQQARTALQVARLLDHDEEMKRGRAPQGFELRAETLVRALTIWGAEALGLADVVGSLKVGKKADIVVIRGDQPNTAPINDPYATLITQAHPGNIDAVLVDGRPAKLGGTLVQDWRLVQRDLEASRARISERISEIGGWFPSPEIPLPW